MNTTDALVNVEQVTRRFPLDHNAVTALDNLSLAINRGEFLAITGPSGSGKSSLLYLLGLLDQLTNGRLWLDGIETSTFDENHLADIRLSHLGFVFQANFLLPEFTARENVLLPIRRLGKLDEDQGSARAAQLLADHPVADAAVAPPGIHEQYSVEVLAERIGDNPNAVTRFVLVTASTVLPPRTGADKTSVIVELPTDQPGGLVEMLEQFATRGVNLSLLQSRPIGDALGRYRFVVDLDGHVLDERVADALLGLKRFSPNVIFLGSYPRADRVAVTASSRYDDEVFIDARDWLRGLISGEPG